MKMTLREVFPTLFYEFNFSQDQISPLYKEMQDKKEIIKNRSYDFGSEIDYWTDFRNPIKLLTYEKLVKEIPPQFAPQLSCKHMVYWTAIYEEKGYHAIHNHSGHAFDPYHINMSSVLSLSDIGSTEFYNPKQADGFGEKISFSSKIGRMIMFPSHILHEALAHGKKDEERVIVSSNWQVYYSTHEKD